MFWDWAVTFLRALNLTGCSIISRERATAQRRRSTSACPLPVGPILSPPMKNLLFATLLLVALSPAFAQQSATPWPTVLLDKPFHVGDDSNKEMRNPRPDAPKFTARFDLPANIQPGITTLVHITIQVGGLMPGSAKGQSAGLKATKLVINGTEVAVLNKLVRGADSPRNVQKLQIKIPGGILRATANEVAIFPGADTHTLDDFELHRVVVGTSPE